MLFPIFPISVSIWRLAVKNTDTGAREFVGVQLPSVLSRFIALPRSLWYRRKGRLTVWTGSAAGASHSPQSGGAVSRHEGDGLLLISRDAKH